MAAAETARLIASLELHDNKFGKGIDRAIGSVGKLETRMSKLGGIASKGLSKASANIQKAIVGATVAAGGLLVASIKAGSDLAETQSKVGVVFQDSAKEVLAFGKTSVTSLGLSENAALGAIATYGNLFVSMGLGTDKAADMSTKLVQLAADLASFNNIDPTEAAEKLRAGLTGESEPLKSLGININETIIKAKALELGLVKTGKSTASLTLKNRALNDATAEVAVATKKYGANSTQALKAIVKQEAAQKAVEDATTKFPGTLDAATKAQAAYALIFEQSATAQGDFARTSGGLANQIRILKAGLENIGATIGTAVLPKVTPLIQKLNDFINLPTTQANIATLAGQIADGFEDAAKFIAQIDFGQIATSLQVAGTFAQTLMGAFLSAPTWLQTAVITGWGLNKLTGGAVGSIVGELGKGLIKGVLGMNAGVVNINAGVVNGAGGFGAVGAAAKGGGVLGKLSGALGILSIVGSLTAVVGEQQAISAQSTAQGKELNATLQEMLRQNPNEQALKNALGGVEQGIRDIESNPLNVLVQGDALTELKSMRDQINKALTAKGEKFGPPTPAGFGNAPIDERAGFAKEAGMSAILQRALAKGFKPTDAAVEATYNRNLVRAAEQQKAAIDAVKAQENRTTAAALLTAAAVQNLDRQKPPTVNVTTNVNVTAAQVNKSVVVQRRAGPSGGSRERSGPLEF